jgi:hypothetical protein
MLTQASLKKMPRHDLCDEVLRLGGGGGGGPSKASGSGRVAPPPRVTAPSRSRAITDEEKDFYAVSTKAIRAAGKAKSLADLKRLMKRWSGTVNDALREWDHESGRDNLYAARDMVREDMIPGMLQAYQRRPADDQRELEKLENDVYAHNADIWVEIALGNN